MDNNRDGGMTGKEEDDQASHRRLETRNPQNLEPEGMPCYLAENNEGEEECRDVALYHKEESWNPV